MIYISKEHEITNRFQGSEKKKTILYNGKKYLAKFPDPNRRQKLSIHYINNIFSEYIGCHIFQSLDIEAQNTILAEFELPSGENRVVCLCEDFTTETLKLQELQSQMLSRIEIEKSTSTELEDVLYTLRTYANPQEIEMSFWDMFIVDSFIGNPDRHNENWGVLEDITTGEIRFAPIYDCGSALNAIDPDSHLQAALGSQGEFNQYLYNTFSALRIGGKRVSYAEFLKDCKYRECRQALLRIVPKINMEEIEKIVNGVAELSSVRKQFLSEILISRYEKILVPEYKKIMKYGLDFEEKE